MNIFQKLYNVNLTAYFLGGSNANLGFRMLFRCLTRSSLPITKTTRELKPLESLTCPQDDLITSRLSK